MVTLSNIVKALRINAGLTQSKAADLDGQKEFVFEDVIPKIRDLIKSNKKYTFEIFIRKNKIFDMINF